MIKIVILSLIAVLLLPLAIDNSFAAESYEFRGSGLSLDSNLESPTLYQSTLWINFNSLSEITKGSVILKSADDTIAIRMVADEWSLSYNADGSFIASGPVYTLQDKHYTMKINGERKFVANNWSMWEAVGVIDGNGQTYSIKAIITGDDRFAKNSPSQIQRIAIPSGNAQQHEMGSYIPKSPTIFRGTTVTWMNHDSVTHTVQSQDGKGNVIAGFNSDILKAGDTFTHQFSEPGIYHYLCTLHPWRTGTVSVI